MKIAIVGTGKIVGEVLVALQSVEDITVAAICSRPQSREKAMALATQYNINKVYTDYDQLLADADIDFVYIGIVNDMHFPYALKALSADKHVILEKPFCTTFAEAEQLCKLARQCRRYLFEAITTIHMPNYQHLKSRLTDIGTVRLMQANYSQYSSRYDKYLQGILTPAFDVIHAGGALMDINLYNIYLTVALFGQPVSATYACNRGFNGVDTSGVALLNYPGMVAVCSGAKDSASPGHAIIQGEKGTIVVDGIPSTLPRLTVSSNRGDEVFVQEEGRHRLTYEFQQFAEVFAADDYEQMSARLDTTLDVMRTLDMLRRDA